MEGTLSLQLEMFNITLKLKYLTSWEFCVKQPMVGIGPLMIDSNFYRPLFFLSFSSFYFLLSYTVLYFLFLVLLLLFYL